MGPDEIQNFEVLGFLMWEKYHGGTGCSCRIRNVRMGMRARLASRRNQECGNQGDTEDQLGPGM